MKNLIVVIGLTFLFSLPVFSQDYKIDWGPSYKREGGIWASNNIIGVYGNHYYTLNKSRKSSTLLKFDMKHKLISTKSVERKFKGEKISFDNFIDTKNGTYAYMKQLKNGTWRVLISKFDGNDFGEIKEVFSHDFEMKYVSLYGFGINQDAINKLVVSMNEKYVAYTNTLSMKEKNGKEEKTVVAVFDENMKLVWNKEQSFGYKDKKMVIQQTVVDGNGVVYVLASVSDKARKLVPDIGKGKKNKVDEKSKNLPKFHYSIFRITDDDFKEFKIELDDSELAPIDIAMYFPEKGKDEMIVSGFYTDSERKSSIKGMFYVSGNNENGIENVQISPFEDEFLEDIVSKRSLEKDRGLSSTYRIDDFIHFSDGSLGFIAEQYYVSVHTYTDSQGRTRTSHTYHSNTILIPRFSKDGELLNVQKIKKGFSSSSSWEASYSIAVANDKIYLVFNDFKSKDERKEMKGKRRWRYTDLVVMNLDGEIEFNETLFNSNEIDLTFVPFMSDYSGNTLIIGSVGRKKYAFGTIKLD